MEFLFTDKGASIEAIILLICLVILLSFLLYEGYIFARRFYAAFGNKRVQVGLVSSTQVSQNTSQDHIENSTQTTIVEESKQSQETTSETQELTLATPPETVNEEEIYAEYVALVDETHAEKEKITTEEKVDHVMEDLPAIENINFDVPIDEEEAITHTPLGDELHTIQTIESKTESIESDGSTEIDQASAIPTDVQSAVLQNQIDETVDVSGDAGNNFPDHILTIEDGVSSKQEKHNEQIVSKEVALESQGIEPFLGPSISTPPPSPPIKNHSETIFSLLNTIKTVMARGQLVEARSLIIQGLSLDKGNRELNLLLGSLYEGDRHFEKAEYVYKDLALDYPDDIEILEKLGNVLIIEKRYTIAHEIYKKILSIGGETEGTLYILSHLCHELNDAHEGYIYMKKYLKSWPNNPEILALISEVEVELGKRKDAIETLKRLKNLTPYNSEITATLQKLMMEEELAGNFGNQS
ncbi:hypothetical protein KBD33_03770 [Candidatus Gracilibacteria bacterium]|nr:hypothetical protein [Candidatus Gracilibacteria bacterium]